ncbi:MAG TPA: hypothetical protein VNS12_10740 [Pelagibacterium sp.]|uniref:hypothetical protein n=1 Tax=Pelagibacterium sp. TaxID=1967288 RepID=UPI002C035B69|nr:hypothetical protein [Pelagibacterium sp.]HWJ88538.1 hypothetical protein [Pelagibacterium sp.]
MGEDVSQFVVVAPSAMGKAVEYAEARILDRLGRSFPEFEFQIEAFGPFVEPDEFSVIPVMSRPQREGDDPERIYMCKPLEPWVIPAIKEVLKEFELGVGLN